MLDNRLMHQNIKFQVFKLFPFFIVKVEIVSVDILLKLRREQSKSEIQLLRNTG